MTARDADSPGIRFPPPLVYVAPMALGFLFHRAWPVGIGPTPIRPMIVMVGWALIALWASIQLPAYYLFYRARTSLMPSQPATMVVEVGPYRWSRNPMYVGLTVLSIGVAFVFNALWPLVLLPVAVLVTDRYIIPREEQYLERAFGDGYREYRNRVRRWL